jgi:membrane protein
MNDTVTSTEGEDWSAQEGRGRSARRVRDIPFEGWKDILWRTKDEITADRISLVAAGVTFYLLLALFPALAALVSVYGLFADPQNIQEHIAALSVVLPSGAVELLRDQLQRLAEQSGTALGVTFFFGLAVALWSANKGIKALFDAMNVAYDEDEKRGFILLNLITLGFTLGAIIVAILFMVAVAVVPVVVKALGLGGWLEWLVQLARWPILLIVAAVGVAILNRYGPSRSRARWRWLTWGSGLTVLVWIAASIAFSWYLSNFGNYNETYGSLGAAIGFLMWLWISVFVLLAGAELNSEIEHQTAEDTTVGRDRPLGQRGARMADTVGSAVGKKG